MGIIKAIGDVIRGPSSQASDGYPFPDDQTPYGDAVDPFMVARAQYNPTVFSCLSLISKSLSHVRFTTGDKYWDRTFIDPNIHQGREDFWRSVIWELAGGGNVYISKSKKKRGTKGMLYPRDPTNVEPLGTPLKPSYRLRDESDKIVTSDEMIHIRHGGGANLRAIGPIAAGYPRIQALEWCDREIENVFKNGINAGYVLHGGHTDKESLLNMMKSIQKAFGIGGKSRGGVVGLSADYKLDKFPGVTPADSHLRNLRIDLIREIAALFGVPPFAVGGSSDTKFSNVVARYSQLSKDALIPILESIKSGLEHNLGVEVSYNENDILKGDFATKSELAQKECGGPFRTPNEVRELYFDSDEIEGGDELRNLTPEIEPDRSGENPPDGTNSDR